MSQSSLFFPLRHYRDGDENAVPHPIREGDAAVEQIHEQHLRAAEQT